MYLLTYNKNNFAGAGQSKKNGIASTGLTFGINGILTVNLSTGVSGGQSVIGGTASGDSLTLVSTTNATKGKIYFGASQLSAYDGVNNRLGIGQATPTARLHLAAGTATASTGPLKFTSGTNLTTPEAGTMEFNGSSLYFTPSTTRMEIPLVAVGDSVATLTNTVTLTNKRITQRVISMADATSITLAADTADFDIHVNTQTAGTLTINAPSGTPTEGQPLTVRIKCTNVQTISWNGIFRGSTDGGLPSATSGGGLTDYYFFKYNSVDSTYDYLAKNFGF